MQAAAVVMTVEPFHQVRGSGRAGSLTVVLSPQESTSFITRISSPRNFAHELGRLVLR